MRPRTSKTRSVTWCTVASLWESLSFSWSVHHSQFCEIHWKSNLFNKSKLGEAKQNHTIMQSIHQTWGRIVVLMDLVYTYPIPSPRQTLSSWSSRIWLRPLSRSSDPSQFDLWLSWSSWESVISSHSTGGESRGSRGKMMNYFLLRLNPFVFSTICLFSVSLAHV